MTNPVVYYYGNGNKSSEYWGKNGRFHREDGPAIIYYYESGNIEKEYWLKNGQHHKEDGPATFFYHENGNIEEELWYINDQMITENIIEWLNENNIVLPFSDTDKMAFKLRWL